MLVEIGSFGKITESPENCMITVNHPVFVAQYFAYVFPMLNSEQRINIKEYAYKHRNVIDKYCKLMDIDEYYK